MPGILEYNPRLLNDSQLAKTKSSFSRKLNMIFHKVYRAEGVDLFLSKFF